MQCLLQKQLERNSRIDQSIHLYSESHKTHKLKASRFRIRRRQQ